MELTDKWDEVESVAAELPLLPQPNYAVRLEEAFEAVNVVLRINPALAWLAEEIAECWAQKYGVITSVAYGAEDEWNISLTDAKAEAVKINTFAALNCSAGIEAYAIRVDSNGIALAASGYRGVIYAWFTLKQWLQFGEEEAGVQGLLVRDEPDLAMRGFHFDLKGAVPTAHYMKETIERLANYKINTLMIEYENQFQFSGVASGVWKQGGLTSAELNDVLNHARRYGMEMIPVIQCLGHVDYILRNEEYADLREEGLASQYCPSNPRTFQFVSALIDEIIEAHSDAEYIHIGADETWALGKCEQCREAMRNGGKADLYLAYVGQIASYVLSKGKRPIIWDDMFHLERCVERVVELPKGTVICSWSYYEFGEANNWFWYGGRYYSSQRWHESDPGAAPGRNAIEDMPEEDLAVARKWWDEGSFPEYGSSAVPWVRHYQEQGYDVIGASSARGADYINQWSGYPVDRLNNVRFWAGHAARSSMTGTIASAWTRFYSLSPPVEHWETGWYPAIAQAAYSWNPAMEAGRFDGLFTRCFLGGDTDVMIAMKWIEKAMEIREEFYFGRKSAYLQGAVRKLEASVGRKGAIGRYVEGLRLTALYEDIVVALEQGLKMNEWRMYYIDSQVWPDKDYMVNRDLGGLRKALERAVDWEKEAMKYCGTFMPDTETEELVMTKLHAYKARANLLLRQLTPN
jgi:hypothetical protein